VDDNVARVTEDDILVPLLTTNTARERLLLLFLGSSSSSSSTTTSSSLKLLLLLLLLMSGVCLSVTRRFVEVLVGRKEKLLVFMLTTKHQLKERSAQEKKGQLSRMRMKGKQR